MKTELKPCPFCGGPADFQDDGHIGYAYCIHCLARTDDYYSWRNKNWKEDAARDWNDRVYPKEVQEAIERDKPRNPVRPKGYSNIECPTCGAHLKQYYEPEEANVPFCYHCGQRLDWGRDD